jgi:ABC-2 type transport system ATP-binding protein
LENVVKRYRETTALDHLTLHIETGKVTALLGPNGAGKTTAVALLLGLISADEGHVQLLGRSPQSRATRQRMGVMLQRSGLPEALRVGEILGLVESYYPYPRPRAEVTAIAGIEDLLGRLYGTLSGGQQRRVQLALAICGAPEVLFLDEPTLGLDIEARESLWLAVRELVRDGCAVLLTTHYLEEAEALADRVAVLTRGRLVVEGTVDEIRAQCVRRRIRCITAMPAELVAKWPGVSAATRQEHWLNIEASVAVEPIVRRLLEVDPKLRELEVHRAGLADAFVQITREAA